MKFIVAFLAVLAVGSVSAQNTALFEAAGVLTLSYINVFNGITNITDILVNNVAALTAVKSTVNTQANNIFNEIGKIPDLCKLAEDPHHPGLLEAVVDLVLGLLVGTPTIGTHISKIIGYIETAAKKIQSVLPTHDAAVIKAAVSSIFSTIKAAVTAAITALEQGEVDFDSNVNLLQEGLKALVQMVQSAINSCLDGLSGGPLGSVFGAILGKLTTKLNVLLQQVTCLAGKITGVGALKNIVHHLKDIRNALTARGIK